MTMSPHRAILALGVYRLNNLHQKQKQRDRARKMTAYLKMSKAIYSDLFKCQLRFDSDSLFRLLGLVRPFIEGLDVDLEEISVEERLLVTLKYLATGYTFEQLSYGPVKAHLLMRIIPETCRLISKCLKEYTKLPKSEREWVDIAASFDKKCNFSHCVGALAAKHLLIDEPKDDPHDYVNHKKSHSIVLVVVANANHEFTYINVGCNGGYQYIYESTEFFDLLTNSSLSLPEDCPLFADGDPMPFVFVGDTKFLIENIMRPFPSDNLSHEKKIFNYRLSRAKRVADNAVGIMYERFGIFHRNLSVREQDLNSVVMACCSLHNYLVRNSETYVDEQCLDVEDVDSFTFKPASWRKKEDVEWTESHPLLSLEAGREEICDSLGESVRDRFTSYFNNEGTVSFQDRMVNVVPA